MAQLDWAAKAAAAAAAAAAAPPTPSATAGTTADTGDPASKQPSSKFAAVSSKSKNSCKEVLVD